MRLWIEAYNLTLEGRYASCNASLPGRWRWKSVSILPAVLAHQGHKSYRREVFAVGAPATFDQAHQVLIASGSYRGHQ